MIPYKKDWYDMVVIDDYKAVVNSFHSQPEAKLRDFSRTENAFLFDFNDYEDTQIIPQETEIHIMQLLNIPTDAEFAHQRDLLQGKQQEKWIKFNNEIREFVETEVTIHENSSVTKLGWEPANTKKTIPKDQGWKIKRHYLLMVVKPNSTVLCIVPATSNWVEKTLKKCWQQYKKPFFFLEICEG